MTIVSRRSTGISGLALSVACCLIILMHIRFESSYDTYHRDADRIYRIGIDIDTPSFKRTFAPISYFMAPYLKENYPQVEEVTRFRRFSSVLVQREEMALYEDNFIKADLCEISSRRGCKNSAPGH
jgi:putative ABC transport system permease protein